MSTTAKRVLRAVELRQPNGKPASFLVNRDLLPVPPEERLWKAINYATFWLADSFNVNTFMIASSGISLGLTWWQVWLCVALFPDARARGSPSLTLLFAHRAVWCGYAFAGVFVVLNATAGAK